MNILSKKILTTFLLFFLLNPVYVAKAQGTQIEDNTPSAAQTLGDALVGDPVDDPIDIVTPDVQINVPGLNFTDPSKIPQQEEARDGQATRFFYVPFLGEYILAVYRYSIALASILAVVMVVIAGFQWIISGGNAEAIGRAKKRITGAIVGLLLAVGSYTLLAAVNPELVSFRSLKVNFVTTEDLDTTFFKGELPGDSVSSRSRSSSRTRRTSTTRTATSITRGSMSAALDVVDNYSKKKIDNDLVIESECPLTNHNKIFPDNDRAVTGAPGAACGNCRSCPTYSFSESGLNDLFQQYSWCVPVDETLLRAISFRESGHNSQAVNCIGFTGLFQTKETRTSPYCSDNIKGFGLSARCKNLQDPQTSTMVGAAILRRSINIIVGLCGEDISGEALAFYSFIGHHSGHGNLRRVLSVAAGQGCRMSSACEPLLDGWQNFGSDNRFRDDNYGKTAETCKKIVEELGIKNK